MGAMVCDICGGKLVVGQGGVAKCESCEMEYTSERLKEKAQTIKGTVQIDNSNMVDNWMKMADSAMKDENFSEAYNYYNKVLEVNPDNWKAIYGKGKAAGWQTTLLNSRIPEFISGINSALKIIENSDYSQKEINKIRFKFADGLHDINEAYIANCDNYFNDGGDYYIDIHNDTWHNLHYDRALECIELEKKALRYIQDIDNNNIIDINIDYVKLRMKKFICDILTFMCRCTDRCWNYRRTDYTAFGLFEHEKANLIKEYEKLLIEIWSEEPEYERGFYSGDALDPFERPVEYNYLERCGQIEEYWKKKEPAMHAKAKNIQIERGKTKYWSEHAEEKKELEEKIKNLDLEIKQAEKNLDPFSKKIIQARNEGKQLLPAEIELSENKDTQNRLNKKKSELGIFARKEKKDIQEQIDALQIKESRIEEVVKQQKKERDSKINKKIKEIENEMKPYNEKLSKLKKEKDKINHELNKAR